MLPFRPIEAPTRQSLHRVATHILARRRADVTGRFGLRAGPGGFATPAFGDGPEVVRVAGTTLVREIGGDSSSAPIVGSTLRHLAVVAGVDLDAPFSAGASTPPLGDVDAVIDLDSGAAEAIAAWFDLAWKVLDAVVAALAPTATPATVQLWPEHFDAATSVTTGSGERVNLGFSVGDDFEAGPYAYLGPWSAGRPGGPGYWNAPFGAVLRRSDTGGSPDACAEFFRVGLRRLGSTQEDRRRDG